MKKKDEERIINDKERWMKNEEERWKNKNEGKLKSIYDMKN